MEIRHCTDRRFKNMCDSTKALLTHEDTGYVSTYYERSAMRLLKEHGRIFIKGRSGSGKSRLGLRLLATLSENKSRTPVLLTSAEEWKLIPKTTAHDRRRYIVMLDDVFGSSNFVPSRVDGWKRTFDIMWPSIESKHIFLVITSRPEISIQCEKELKKYDLMQDMPCVSLDEGEYILQESEKRKMLQTICPTKSGLMPKEIQDIASARATLGFPQCCKFFASSKQAQSKGVSFFFRPHDYVLEEIDRLKESDSLGYLVLLLVLMQNGCMKKTLLERRTKELSNMLETLKDVCADMPELFPSLVRIREKADALCGVYLVLGADGYKFQHQSISECVFITLSNIDTNLCIEACPVPLLLELIQTRVNDRNENEIVILLTEDHYPAFADRITKLLLTSTSSKEILNHTAFQDDDFIRCLVSKWTSEGKVPIIWQHNFESKTQMCFTSRETASFSIIVALFEFQKIVPFLILKNIKTLVDTLIALNKDEGSDVLQECLPCAVYVGRNDLVKTLLDYGATPDDSCFRALCPARHIDTDVADTIFKVVVAVHEEVDGADPDKKLTWDSISNLRDLFWLAVMNGNVHIVQLLVKRLKSETNSLTIFKKALVGLVKELSKGHRCPAFTPYNMTHLSEIIKILLGTGCKVDLEYLILQAATHTDATVLRLFLAQGVHVDDIYVANEDVYSTEDYYPTPLQQAAAYGGEDCLEEILSCSHVISSNHSLLHTAVKHGNTECASLLIQKGVPVNTQDRNGDAPLHVAVKHNQLISIEQLLSKHASVDIENSDGCIPLLCIDYSSPPDINVVATLIDAGSNINEVDKQQRTLLYKAAEYGDLATVKYLCNKGANVNIDTQQINISCMAITDEQKLCKRVILAACRNADIDTVKLLCEHGADVDIVDVNGETVIHKAAASRIDAVEKLQYLLDIKQVPLSIRDNSGRTALFPAVMSALQTGYLEVLHFLASRKMDLKQRDTYGDSLLLYALTLNPFDSKHTASEGFINLMLSHGIDPNIKNLQGRAVLHYAAVRMTKDKLTLLLDGGADPCVQDETGQTVLHYAVKKRSVDNARLFLEKGADPCVQDQDGKTALHFAVELKDSDTVKLLLNKRADPCVSDNYGRDALFYAVKGQSSLIMKLLLQNGANPCVQDRYGTTILHIAARCLDKENVMLLLEHKADPRTQDQHFQTTLHFAAHNTNSEVVRLLLERGVDSFVQDDSGMTALHCAVLNCNTESVELLLERCPVRDIQDREGKTPLHHAAETEYTNIVKLLLENNFDPSVQDHCGETPLHYAAKRGYKESVELIVEKGVDVSIKDQEGLTALHHVAHISKDSVQLLLVHGADSSAKDHMGRTPLHLATAGGCNDSVKLLLENGADPCAKDDLGKTPLHLAAIHNEDIINILFEKGANAHVQDKEGKTPLHYASERNLWNCAHLLLENGADPCLQDQQGKTALHTAVEAEFSFGVFTYTHTSYRYVTKRKKKKSIVKLLIDKGSNPCMVDKQGRTALHYAAERGCSDSVHLLLGNNPMSFIKDEQGRTPLHCAAAKGIRDNVELFLDKGADLYAKDQQGRTPLHCAAEAEGDCSEIVKLLLEKGADPLMMDQQGMTALDYATRGGNTASVKLLHGRVSEKQ